MTKNERREILHVATRLGTLATLLGAFESCVKNHCVPADEPLDFENSERMKIVQECMAILYEIA